MANYHVLQCSHKKDSATVVFHISVPDENNSVGVNLRTAVKHHYPVETSQVPWLEASDPTEFTQIQNGEIYEHSELVEFNATLTVAEKRAICDSRYTSLVSVIQDRIGNILEFWGLDRDV